MNPRIPTSGGSLQESRLSQDHDSGLKGCILERGLHLGTTPDSQGLQAWNILLDKGCNLSPGDLVVNLVVNLTLVRFSAILSVICDTLAIGESYLPTPAVVKLGN